MMVENNAPSDASEDALLTSWLKLFGQVFTLRATTQGRVCLTYHVDSDAGNRGTDIRFRRMVDKAERFTTLSDLSEMDTLLLVPSLGPQSRVFDQRGRMWIPSNTISMQERVYWFTLVPERVLRNCWALRALRYVEDPGAFDRLLKPKPELDDEDQAHLFDELTVRRQRTTYKRKERGQ